MSDLIHPTKSQVLHIHRAVLNKDEGSDGLRDEALLESALAAPQATFGGVPIVSDPLEVAAAYLFYLCNNHPFVDGSKRVAFAACIIFLKLNGFQPSPDSPAWEALVLDVAASCIGKAELALRLKALISDSS